MQFCVWLWKKCVLLLLRQPSSQIAGFQISRSDTRKGQRSLLAGVPKLENFGRFCLPIKPAKEYDEKSPSSMISCLSDVLDKCKMVGLVIVWIEVAYWSLPLRRSWNSSFSSASQGRGSSAPSLTLKQLTERPKRRISRPASLRPRVLPMTRRKWLASAKKAVAALDGELLRATPVEMCRR